MHPRPFAIFFLIISGLCFSGVSLPRKPGLSSKELARIGPMVRQYIDNAKIAGAVTLVVRNGKIAHLEAHGLADKETARPMQTDSLFRIFSMTKQVTATAILMLIDEGKIGLHDPLSKHIPAFAAPKVAIACQDQPDCPEVGYRLVPAKRPITVQHLLSHTSGLPYIFNAPPYLVERYLQGGVTDGLNRTEGTIGDMVKKLAAQPLVAHPGERFYYGLSTDVLGYLVEVASGKSLAQFFQERLFDPLGMVDTHFFLPKEKVHRLAKAYSLGPAGKMGPMPAGTNRVGNVIYGHDFHYGGPTTYYSGGAGLVATAEDYARLLIMLVDGSHNGKTYVRKETLALMRKNYLNEGQESMKGYGFGLGPAVHMKAERSGLKSSVGEWRWGGLFNTSFSVDPEQGMVLVFMSQLFPYSGVGVKEDFHDIVYGAVTEPVP